MPIARFDKVILYVQDMARMVAFYRDAFGLALTYPAGDVDLAKEVWVTLDLGCGCTLALHGGGKRRLGEDAPSLVFRCDDLATAGAALSAAGARLAEPFEAAPGTLVAKGRDPEGNAFSLEASA
jgi:predicted enzyme related to lactoylglutathione lyase